MIPFLLWIETLDESEREIFERIYYDYSFKIKGLALKILRNETDAEDVVGEVFQKVIKYKDHFIGVNDGEVKRLIVIYTRSVCFNIIKRRNIIKFDSYEQLTDNGLDVFDIKNEMTDEEMDEKLIRKETAEYLAKAIGKLGSPAMEIVSLTYFKNYSSSQIGEILNMNPSTVRSCLQSSRAKLRRELEDYFNGNAE